MSRWDRRLKRNLLSGGETGVLIAAHDWSSTSLGPRCCWPQSLKAAVDLLLLSPVPIVLLWGKDGVMLYNDAYSKFAKGRHPEQLGMKVREGWPEVADFNDNVMRVVLAGRTLTYTNKELTLFRHGLPELVAMDLNYSPVLDESGYPAGVICILAETTERLASDRRLETERGRQRLMLQKMPGFVALFSGPEHQFEFVNDAYIEMSGKGDYLGRSVREVFPDVAGQSLYERLDYVYATGQPFAARAVQTLFDRAAGDRFVDLHYEPLRNNEGLITGVFVGGYDVTEQERSHRRRDAILTLNARLRDTTDPAELAYTSAKLLGEVLGACRAGYGDMDAGAGTITVARAWGLSELPDVAGVHNFADFGTYIDDLRSGQAVTVSDVETDVRTIDRVDAFRAIGTRAFLDAPVVEEGLVVAEVFVHASAPRVWTADDVLLAGEFAKHTRSTVARRDAEVARLRVEAALDLSRESLSLAVDAAQIGTWNLDVREDVLTCNNRARAAFGISPDASVSMSDFYAGLHSDDLDATTVALAKAPDSAHRVAYDVEFRTIGAEDAVVRWVAAKGLGLFDDNGRCLRAFGTVIDITERKRVEGELRSLAETLEQRVAARAAELESAQELLRQSQKMEAMGSLTGGVAHDFNNLLTPILGSLDMLQRGSLGGEREQRLIAGALQSADRAKTLVQRLLAFARRQPLQATSVDLGALVHGMADLISSTTGPRIKVVVNVGDGLPPAKADINQLEMAILNLAVNARDAMLQGGVLRISVDAVTVGWRADLTPGKYLLLSIADTGVGMDEVTIKRAIEPFFSTKGVGKGTGLGLSMAHGLASQLGGSLMIRSTLGVGTTVEFWLPQSGVELATLGRPTTAEPTLNGNGVALLVDDEDLVRLSTADMLIELGYHVVEAATAEQALNIIDHGLRPNLLVTDHLMPGMTGTELARTLLQNTPQAKVLIVSGYAESEGIAPDLPRLTKPFRSADLAASLAALD